MFLRSDNAVIAVVCGGLVCLYMPQRSVTHRIRTANEPVLSEPYAHKEIIVLHHIREPLEIVRALCIKMPVIDALIHAHYLVDTFFTAPKFVAHRHHAE